MMHPNAVDLSKFLPDAPLLSSRQQGWNGILIEQHSHPQGQIPERNYSEHILTLHLAAPTHLVQRTGGRTHDARLIPGDMTFTPAEQETGWHCKPGCNLLYLRLNPLFIAQVAAEISTPREELKHRFAFRDPHLEFIGRALLAELAAFNPGGRLYAESLTNALSVHLLRHYREAIAFPAAAADRGLTPKRLRLALDYIHENLDRNFSLEDLAALTGVSAPYFAAQFRQSTGFAPHQYVIRERVERAKILLLRGELSIAAVAAEVGFADQSHLNRHMKRVLRVTPKAFLKSS